MTIKELMEYIMDSFSDGTLNENDEVFVGDSGKRFEVRALFNDTHELTISDTEY